MNTHKALPIAVMALMLSLPGLAAATALWHQSNDEAGVIVHANYMQSTQARADVQRELDAARADGSLWYLNRGLPVPERPAQPGKTRAEVQREVSNMTAEERQQWQTVGGP